MVPHALGHFPLLNRQPVRRLIAQLADKTHQREPDRAHLVRLPNCIEMCAQESSCPRRLAPLEVNDRVSSGRKQVVDYLP